MLKKAGVLIVAAALGTGAAAGVVACGEDREGEVEFQTEGTGTEGGTGTETAPSTETTPETETESSGGATAPEETETAP